MCTCFFLFGVGISKSAYGKSPRTKGSEKEELVLLYRIGKTKLMTNYESRKGHRFVTEEFLVQLNEKFRASQSALREFDDKKQKLQRSLKAQLEMAQDMRNMSSYVSLLQITDQVNEFQRMAETLLLRYYDNLKKAGLTYADLIAAGYTDEYLTKKGGNGCFLEKDKHESRETTD